MKFYWKKKEKIVDVSFEDTLMAIIEEKDRYLLALLSVLLMSY